MNQELVGMPSIEEQYHRHLAHVLVQVVYVLVDVVRRRVMMTMMIVVLTTVLLRQGLPLVHIRP